MRILCACPVCAASRGDAIADGEDALCEYCRSEGHLRPSYQILLRAQPGYRERPQLTRGS